MAEPLKSMCVQALKDHPTIFLALVEITNQGLLKITHSFKLFVNMDLFLKRALKIWGPGWKPSLPNNRIAQTLLTYNNFIIT